MSTQNIPTTEWDLQARNLTAAHIIDYDTGCKAQGHCQLCIHVIKELLPRRGRTGLKKQPFTEQSSLVGEGKQIFMFKNFQTSWLLSKINLAVGCGQWEGEVALGKVKPSAHHFL